MIAGVVLRPGVAADLPFAVNSWLRSYRIGNNANVLAKRIPHDAYYADAGFKGAIIRRLTHSTLTVAVDADDSETIYGWACTDPDVVHYVYVKDVMRRKGIGRALCPSASVATCITDTGRQLLPGLKFSPYALCVV